MVAWFAYSWLSQKEAPITKLIWKHKPVCGQNAKNVENDLQNGIWSFSESLITNPLQN